MYHRIIILALLFFPFPGKTISPNFDNSLMEISNALPVQFWLVGCDTYNEHEAAGVHHKCYCAPWQCDDEIKVQFKDTPGSTFSLLIYDDSEQLLDSKEIEEVATGVYEYNLVLSQNSPDICEQQIQLQIIREAGQQGISLPALNLWNSEDLGGIDWVDVGTLNPSVSHTAPLSGTDLLWVDFPFTVGNEYTILVTVNAIDDPGTTVASLAIQALDSSFSAQFSQLTSGIVGNVTLLPLVFTATPSTTRVGIVGFLEGATITLESVIGTTTIGASEIVAKSDCLDIRQEHEDSILLTYSNHRNFAGLVYEDFSPANEFQIRIPATFFHQRFPEEDEVMELSSSLVTLNGTVRKQRLLDTDYLPYYFHEKLKLILKHQILEIFNRQWVKQEGYEIVEGDRRWPVKKAKCWLSEKDFVHRNIL